MMPPIPPMDDFKTTIKISPCGREVEIDTRFIRGVNGKGLQVPAPVNPLLNTHHCCCCGEFIHFEHGIHTELAGGQLICGDCE